MRAGFKKSFVIGGKRKREKEKEPKTPAQIIDNALNKKVPTESYEQKALIKWWGIISKTLSLPENLLFHIPNGGKRTKTEAVSFVSEGVRAGIPDLFLAIPNKQFHGLFIEMKRTRGGVLSEEQKTNIINLRKQGYSAFVCKGFVSASNLIQNYLKSNIGAVEALYWEVTNVK